MLEAALELVSNHGIAGTSLRMLARKLGMQQPSLYHYFGSKDALIDQIVEYCAGKTAPSVMLERYPENNKTPDAMYMKGMSLLKQTRRNDAAKEFLTLIQKYPNAEVAAKARAQRRALGLSVPATPTRSRR